MAVNDVAEIVEIEALVRMALCPPQVVGLCPYHREIVPVVVLTNGFSPTAAGTVERRRSDRRARRVVLILRSNQDSWGIEVDREGTSITTHRPSRHEPKAGRDGVVTVGFIHHSEKDHALIDAEATWRGLRDAVVGWYARINESAHSARFLE